MKRYFCSLLLIAAALVSVNGQTSLKAIKDSPECQRWVDSVYNSLSDRERLAQLFILNVSPSKGQETKDALKKILAEDKMGGILFGRGSIDDFTDIVNYTRSVSELPVMITLDGEWGLSMRIKDTPRFPHNMALGAIDNDTLLYQYGLEVAREFRLMGIDVNFAPVLDVNLNPDNPIIGYRSFGEDPEKVARLGLAYSKGLEDGGIMSCAKHFPGHGDTSVDSHKGLPTVDHDSKQLETIDLRPFKDYIDAGMSGIMMGHLSIPAIDPTGTPSSLSEKTVSGLLCDEMGFDGLIFTDALSMKGASSAEDNCVLALIAGVDVLLEAENPEEDFQAVVDAIESGAISKESIEKHCKKMLAYKYALDTQNPRHVDAQEIKDLVASPQADDINRKLCRALMTVLFNKEEILPIKGLDKKSIALVSIEDTIKEDPFAEFCAKYAKIDKYCSTGDSLSVEQLSAIAGHDIVIVGVGTDQPWAYDVFSQLSGMNGIVPVFFMNPYKMARFGDSVKDLQTLVLAYDDTRYLREYAAQAIFGGINVEGTLPVNLEGIAPMGTGVKLEKTRLGYVSPTMAGLDGSMQERIDSLVNVGLDTKAFPGCQVIVAKDGNIVVDKSYGYLDFSKEDAVCDGTLYDLASVSKATGTLPGVMKAYDEGLFDLDASASDYIPGLKGTGKEDITVRELLYHETGMPPSLNMLDVMLDHSPEAKPFGDTGVKLRRDIASPVATDEFDIETAKGIYVGKITMDTIMHRIYTAKRAETKRFNYSCLNFCLLMNMEQNVTGRKHDEWVNEKIFAPLGSYHTGYRPLNRWELKQIAPTETDTILRGQTVHGYVHDELSDFSGGVQGNAGLFSNAEDLAKLCQMWLNGGEYGGERILSENTVKLFTTDKSKTCRRGLGFDKPDPTNPNNSPTCEEATAATYGHLGFTGTVFWVDPDNGLIFIFLCNRVNPTRDNAAFSKLNIRPKLFSTVYQSILPEE